MIKPNFDDDDMVDVDKSEIDMLKIQISGTNQCSGEHKHQTDVCTFERPYIQNPSQLNCTQLRAVKVSGG